MAVVALASVVLVCVGGPVTLVGAGGGEDGAAVDVFVFATGN